MNRFNYVVLGSDWDLYKQSYSDLNTIDYAQYIAGCAPSRSSVKGFLFRLHFNKWVGLPLKKIWNYFFVNVCCSNDKPVCFILFSNWLHLDTDIVSFLRKKYDNCKIVWFCQDLISTQRMRGKNKKFDVERIKKQFDLVLSFDQKDCVKYGFVYHPLVFSEFHGLKKTMPESDVYMLAKAKNRLEDIYDIYEALRSKGLRLDINLVDVKPEDQKFKDEIHFLDSKGMPYAENLQHILHTKCILEVMQKNGAGFTQRGCEAVCLGKKLLTNNVFIKDEPFFKKEYISTFSSANDLDYIFVDHISDDVDVNFNYKEKMSPIALLNFIEEKLP